MVNENIIIMINVIMANGNISIMVNNIIIIKIDNEICGVSCSEDLGDLHTALKSVNTLIHVVYCF